MEKNLTQWYTRIASHNVQSSPFSRGAYNWRKRFIMGFHAGDNEFQSGFVQEWKQEV